MNLTGDKTKQNDYFRSNLNFSVKIYNILQKIL